MKLKQAPFIIGFALIIAGAILVTGCPGPTTDPEPPAAQLIIQLYQSDNGVIMTSPVNHAGPGDTVTITATPHTGRYVPTHILITDWLGAPITYAGGVIPVSPLEPVTWTFTMPDRNVRVTARFTVVNEAMTSAVSALTEGSSWQEISIANTLLSRTQVHFGALLDVGPQIARLQEVVLDRIRSEKTAWETWFPLPAANRPSVFVEPNESPDRTHLYFLSMGISVPGLNMANTGWTGWELENRESWGDQPPIGTGLYGVLHHTLTFQIGQAPAPQVSYQLFLVPVAQYILEAGTGITSADLTANPIEIIEHSFPSRWPAGEPAGEPDGQRNRNLPWNDPPDFRRIGEVGPEFTYPGTGPRIRLGIKTAPATPADRVFRVTPTPTRICICEPHPAGGCSPLDGPCGALDGTRHVGHFIPRSRAYTITVYSAP